MKISIRQPILDKIRDFVSPLFNLKVVFILALFTAILSTIYSYQHDWMVAYGDAESHLNIAKRVVSSLTPGLAQLGGVWLPFPHMAMVPFVFFDVLWRTAIAGAIVSGIAYIISSLYVYRLIFLFTNNKLASFIGSLIFIFNPNIMYLQTTAMTEPLLICFFLLSSYYFAKYLLSAKNINNLLLAALFSFCASLSRYDGWFLVAFEGLALILYYVWDRSRWKKMEGNFLLFSTLAGLGIVLWMLWCFLILGDPFYFKNSHFSAYAQQLEWLKKGELPAHHNIFLAFIYFFTSSMSNSGFIIFLTALIGIAVYFYRNHGKKQLIFALILLVPFIFNMFTLFMGESIIFIPHLTPATFEWRLFNVRYGIIMLPTVAFFFAYLFYKSSNKWKMLLFSIFLFQYVLYGVGYSKIISLADGVEGLSRRKRPDAEYWMQKHYDGGLVLFDDFSKTMSIIKTGFPMQNVIYIGNKPYWSESLVTPEKYARWIILQKDDEIWKHIYVNPQIQARLYTYFQKVYTSPDILIFKRIPNSQTRL